MSLVSLAKLVSPYCIGMEGNISARFDTYMGSTIECFVIKCSGVSLKDSLMANNYVAFNMLGEQLDNFTRRGSMEMELHRFLYNRFPDVKFIAHTHPVNTLKILCSDKSKSFAMKRMYPEQVIFNDVEMQVSRGEFIVLLGRSGSGKSTFLNLLSGIDPPDSGKIIINGIDISALSERDRTLFRRHHIGIVFQAYNLIPTLTVAENLLLPLELIKRLTRKDRDDVAELLDKLKLSGRLNSYPDRLSGGEQQRVAIARALIHDPDVILADEPTGNLDLDTAGQVLELLDILIKKAGKTMIMATHSQEVIGQADRVFSIRNQSLHLE